MHATTLGQLSQLLRGYVQPGVSFAQSMNQALATIYGMGVWRDLTIEGTFDCSDGYFTLPQEADTVLYAVVDNAPVRVRSLWQDYRATGFEQALLNVYGLVDDGYRPLHKDLATAVSSLYVVGSPFDPANVLYDADTGALVVVDGFNESRTRLVRCTQNGAELTFSEPVQAIKQIRYEGLQQEYNIQTSATDPATTIAAVGPGNGVARFRRYRVPNARTGSFAHVLCKRRFTAVNDDDDPVYIAQTNALKHALLAVVAEDNADLERAEVHWQKCKQVLDDQLDEFRGPARPSLDLQLAGDSVSPVYSSY